MNNRLFKNLNVFKMSIGRVVLGRKDGLTDEEIKKQSRLSNEQFEEIEKIIKKAEENK